jgi:hypothetical protein
MLLSSVGNRLMLCVFRDKENIGVINSKKDLLSHKNPSKSCSLVCLPVKVLRTYFLLTLPSILFIRADSTTVHCTRQRVSLVTQSTKDRRFLAFGFNVISIGCTREAQEGIGSPILVLVQRTTIQISYLLKIIVYSLYSQ